MQRSSFSDNRSVCPIYKSRSMALRLSEKRNIPFQFAKMKLMLQTGNTPAFSETNIQYNQKTVERKTTRTQPQKTLPRIKILDFPPLPTREKDQDSSQRKPEKLIPSKLRKETPKENPNLLTNSCLYIFNLRNG
jgi:hypothetical protein